MSYRAHCQLSAKCLVLPCFIMSCRPLCPPCDLELVRPWTSTDLWSSPLLPACGSSQKNKNEFSSHSPVLYILYNIAVLNATEQDWMVLNSTDQGFTALSITKLNRNWCYCARDGAWFLPFWVRFPRTPLHCVRRLFPHISESTCSNKTKQGSNCFCFDGHFRILPTAI